MGWGAGVILSMGGDGRSRVGLGPKWIGEGEAGVARAPRLSSLSLDCNRTRARTFSTAPRGAARPHLTMRIFKTWGNKAEAALLAQSFLPATAPFPPR